MTEQEKKIETIEISVTLEEVQNFEPSIKKKFNALIAQDKRLKASKSKKELKELKEIEKIDELEAKLKSLKEKKAELTGK